MYRDTENFDSPPPRDRELEGDHQCASHHCHARAIRLDAYGFPVCNHHRKLDEAVQRVTCSPVPWQRKRELVDKFDRREFQSLADLQRAIQAILTDLES